MSDPQRVTRSDSLPPPAPPLPPSRQAAASRPGVLQRLVAPLGFGFSSRHTNSHDHRPGVPHVRGDADELRGYPVHGTQSASHRTGIPIAALDISPNRTRAILAGREILKTVQVIDGKVAEDFNVRSALISYSTRQPGGGRDFLPATDVKWSHSEHDTKIATAASSGRIVLYDLTKPEVELTRLHEHDRQVHKLAFNPFSAAKLLSGSQDGTVKLWDLRLLDGERGAVTMRSQHTFQGRSDAVRDLRWSPTDGFEFAIGTDSGSTQAWDFRYPSGPKLRINAHEKPCYAIDWHPDGKHIVTGGFDKDVKIWDFSNQDRRQKPIFVLRAPQAVMHLRWRPPCWSSELQERGDWQSTQLVTSYNHEDPRIHIWDLRRPYIPFREVGRSRGPPSDLLWHSKDLLWTVGNEGHFQQTDTRYLPRVIDELNPCHISFRPDGHFAKFSEKQDSRTRPLGLHEASANFLNQRSERDGDEKSRSWTDDEAVQDSYLQNSIRRRQSKASSKFSKSQGNTPPSRDERHPVLPLEKSLRKDGPFRSRHIGLMQEITGASIDGPVFHYLVANYASPMTELERRQQSNKILDRLIEAFETNSRVCTEASLHRLAQTWKILGAVIVSELAAWAESNRDNRLAAKDMALVEKEAKNIALAGPMRSMKSELTRGFGHDVERAEKLKSHIFKGVMETGLHKANLSEHDSTSNMTTPLAKPLPDSPLSDQSQSEFRYSNLNGAIDSIAPLPPSVLTSHSTAAAAANALRVSTSPRETLQTSPSPLSDEGQLASSAIQAAEKMVIPPKTPAREAYDVQRSSPQAIVKSPGWYKSRGNDRIREEERRAALRDYRAQSRPVLTFDSQIATSPDRPSAPDRRDSDESFAMFSSSTSSSHKARSMGRSTDSARNLLTGYRHDSFGPGSPPLREGARHSNLSHLFSASGRDDPHANSTLPEEWGTNEASDYRYGPEHPAESRHAAIVDSHLRFNSAESLQQVLGRSTPSSHDDRSTVESSSGTIDESLSFEFERPALPLNLDNSILNRSPFPEVRRNVMEQKDRSAANEIDILSSDLIYTDFRPMKKQQELDGQSDWDASSLIAAAIEFDLTASHDNSTCQFTSHLLMHVAPFFAQFVPSTEPVFDDFVQSSMAARLKSTAHARRIAESALMIYLQFLLSHELYTSAAELRKFAHESSYTHLSRPNGPDGSSTMAQDLLVFLTCGNCGAPLGGRNVGSLCVNCSKSRDPCPICLCFILPSSDEYQSGDGMWTSCIGCGHGGHVCCHSEWLADPESEGSCPTPGCWHDCGPGKIRQNRTDIQGSLWLQEGQSKGARGGVIGQIPSRKDTWVVGQSAAVGRARKVLRERSMASQRKQVRLLAPGEASGATALSSSQ